MRKVTPPAVRFWAKVDQAGPVPEARPDLGACWTWIARATTGHGYGLFWSGVRLVGAHRFAYELVVGPIPAGLEIDHLCRNRGCVNPAHLEPVTARENTLRGESRSAREARQTRCKNGHPFDAANTYVRKSGFRNCRECHRIEALTSWRKARETQTSTARQVERTVANEQARATGQPAPPAEPGA